MTNSFIILGIDPGLKHTGWGVIKGPSMNETHIAHGVIKTNENNEISTRLEKIFVEVENIISRFDPSYISVEKIFLNSNPQSTLKLGQARGIIFLAAARKKISVGEYSPNQIKKTVVGYGHATKYQIKNMLCQIFPDIKIENDDAGDALAIALCHSMHLKNKNLTGILDDC